MQISINIFKNPSGSAIIIICIIKIIFSLPKIITYHPSSRKVTHFGKSKFRWRDKRNVQDFSVTFNYIKHSVPHASLKMYIIE